MRRLPVIGIVWRLFTATTMACVSEAIGLALPGSAGRPAPLRFSARHSYARPRARAVMDCCRANLPARDI